MKLCNICCSDEEEFVKCSFCYDEACGTCWKTFLIQHPQPKCMFCSMKYTEKILRQTFPTGWIENEYCEKIMETLKSIEMSKMNITEDFIPLYQNMKTIKGNIQRKKEEILNIIQDTKLAKDEYTRLNQCKERSFNVYKKIQSLLQVEKNLKIELESMNLELKNCNRKLSDQETVSARITKKIACGFKDCRGTVSDGDPICKICKSPTCMKCHQLRSRNHECNDSDVQSVKLMSEDSKPCPRCNSMIYRIDGCASMFCTNCRTGFNWVTLAINRSAIVDNPHFHQFAATVRRPLQDSEISCVNKLIDTLNPIKIFQRIEVLELKKDDKDKIMKIFRQYLNVNDEILPTLVPKNIYLSDPNRLLRLQFIHSDITEKQYKKELYKINKDQLVNSELFDLYSTFVEVADESLKKYLSKEITFCEWEEEVDHMKKFINDNLCVGWLA